MVFLYLLFAHLLADFVLQPAELLRWKFLNWRGVAFHALIHFLLYLIVFLPYLPDTKVFAVLCGLAFTHFLIDNAKIATEKKGEHYLIYFSLDQIMHFFTLLVSSYFLGGSQVHFSPGWLLGWMYGGPFILIGLCILVFLTYTVEIVQYQFNRQKNGKVFFKLNYRAMLKRAIFFGLAYMFFLIFAIHKAASFI